MTNDTLLGQESCVWCECSCRNLSKWLHKEEYLHLHYNKFTSESITKFTMETIKLRFESITPETNYEIKQGQK